MNNTTLWAFETGDPVKSSPVVLDGRVYVGTMGGEVLCLDAYTGHRVWTYMTEGAVESSPAVWGGMVYIGSDDTYVYCLDAIDGDLIWRTATDGEIKSSPIVSEGLVYIGSNDFSVHCLDAEDGGRVWEFETEGYVYSSPSLRDGFAYFGSCDGNMYAVDAASGELEWNYTADFCPASPALTEDLVIFGAYDGLLHYLNRSTGKQEHAVPILFAEIYSSAGLFTYDYGLDYDLPMVFVATTAGKMVGIGPDGEEFWNASHDVGITSSPLVITEVEEPYDPFIVYGDEGGRLHAIEIYNPYVTRLAYLHNFVEWHIKLGSSIQSSPFVWHEKIFVGVEKADGGGRVVCIGAIDPDNEAYVEILGNDNHGADGWFVTCAIHNLKPDSVTIELEGDVRDAIQKDTLPEDPEEFGASFTVTPPEGFKTVVVRAYQNGELALTHVGEVMSLVDGWNEVVVTVHHPKDGQDGIEGIFVASGTVSSNYTIERIYAVWDGSGERFNCSGAPNWTVALETSHLEEGEHVLTFVASDGYREGRASVKVFVGEDKTDPVEALEMIPLIILIILLLVLFLTKPPRKGDRSSDP
jgi:outer membrane protein assembly factor BamB